MWCVWWLEPPFHFCLPGRHWSDLPFCVSAFSLAMYSGSLREWFKEKQTHCRHQRRRFSRGALVWWRRFGPLTTHIFNSTSESINPLIKVNKFKMEKVDFCFLMNILLPTFRFERDQNLENLLHVPSRFTGMGQKLRTSFARKRSKSQKILLLVISLVRNKAIILTRKTS